MKILLMSLFLISLAEAHDNHRVYRNAFRVIQDPAAAVNEECDQNEQGSPGRCESLSTAICSIQKTAATTVDSYDQDLINRFTALPPNSTDLQISRAYLQAVTAAENETATRTGISRDDLNSLMGELRTSMISMISSSPIPPERQTEMKDIVSGIRMVNARELVELEKQRIKSENPQMSDEDVEIDAILGYTETCGTQGMSQNAFYDPPSNTVIFCPGLIQSASEYGRSEAEVLNGLAFTVTHELAHSIDGYIFNGTPDNIDPAVYDQMKACYLNETPSLPWIAQQGEIVADYWGSRVLAERLRSQGVLGEETVANLALAMDGMCGLPGDTDHPDTNFRIDNILARDPQIRAQLECDPPTVERPFCGLSGAQPSRPTAQP